MASKIAWINPDDIGANEGRPFSNRACVRLRCIQPALYLSASGCDVRSFNIFRWQQWDREPDFYSSDIYVVGKAFINIAPVLDRLKSLGKRVVIDACDNIYGPPEDGLKCVYESIFPLADLIIANTQLLADILKDRAGCRVVVIPDHVEGQKIQPSFAPEEGALNLLWFGYPNNLVLLYDCVPRLETLTDKRAIEISAVTSWNERLIDNLRSVACRIPIRCLNWSLEAMKKELAACDMVIIPSSLTPARMTKTANRVMTGLYAGKHIVAFPLPAYEEFSPFICLDDDLARGISMSLNKPDEITQRVAHGQKYIDERYLPEQVSRSWQAALLSGLNSEGMVRC